MHKSPRKHANPHTTPYSGCAFKLGTAIVLACFVFNCSVLTRSAYADPRHKVTMTRLCGSAESPGNQYVSKLIELAFSYSTASVTIQTLDKKCSHARQKELVLQGKSDFFWAATTSEYEKDMIPIRVPVYKGLLGHRIPLIRAADKGNFEHITTLEQLRRLKVGQGQGWADTHILVKAKFDVVQSSDTWNLYHMLHAGRFDLFPRGIMEPWDEVKMLSNMDLAVESSILIIYPMPAYIFISPKKPELASIIEDGLLRAVKDGSFDKAFYSDPQIKQALVMGKLHKRKVFRLENTDLPKETPLDNPSFWLDITKLTDEELIQLANDYRAESKN